MADTSTTVQKLSSEVLGTFVLVFFGCGSVVFAAQGLGGVDFTAIGLTFGLAVMVMAYAVGRISGAHFNPAVSVGAAVGGRMSWRQVPAYVGAQLAGAILAGAVLFALLHGFEGFDSEGSMGQNFFGDQSPNAEFAWWAAFLIELLLTFLFVTVILAVTDARNEHPGLAPLTIGLTLAAIHFVAIPVTGTSVNPVRSIGPALFAGGDSIQQLWLFIIAPLLGGAAAGVVYPLIFGHGTEPVAGSGWRFSRPAAAAVPGYGAPDQFQQEWNQNAATEQAAYAQEPIIQDGWQWDHAAQEWKPLEQWQPAGPATGSTPTTGTTGATGATATPAHAEPVSDQTVTSENTHLAAPAPEQGFQRPAQEPGQQGWGDPNQPR